MSYDYNALVASITQARIQAYAANSDSTSANDNCLEHWQTAMNGFATLSEHCPMTPLLWIHYANAAREFCLAAASSTTVTSSTTSSTNSNNETTIMANQLRLETLELGLLEFPGSALLHVYYQSLLQPSTSVSTETKLQSLQQSIEAVGRGSHQHEDGWVVQLYTWWAAESVGTNANNTKQLQDVFLQRARVPMQHANDAIVYEYQELVNGTDTNNDDEFLPIMDQTRRLAARVFGPYARFEDELDAALHHDGIPLARTVLASLQQGTASTETWTDALCRETTWGMGLGSAPTARIFGQYGRALHARACKAQQQSKTTEESDDEELLALEQSLGHVALAVFERGVAECPTVESLWFVYIRCLLEQIHSNKATSNSRQQELLQRLSTVTRRAVRNCPYSTALVQQQLHAQFVLAQYQVSVLDPDQLLELVQQALERQFLPKQSAGPLYVYALRVVKQRILHLATTKKNVVVFDEPLPVSSKQLPPSNPKDNDDDDEVLDLVEDLSDMMEQIDVRLKKDHSTHDRAVLWNEKALTQEWLLEPLQTKTQPPSQTTTTTTTWDRAVKVHNPPDPDTYLGYIRQYAAHPHGSTDGSSSAAAVANHLRRVRWLFTQAMQSVGKTADASHLAHAWLEFEQTVGSDKSFGKAQKTIARKVGLPKGIATTPPVTTATVTTAEQPSFASEENKAPNDPPGKRKTAQETATEAEEEPDRPVKKQKLDSEALGDATSTEMAVDNPESPAETKKRDKPGFKTHPFTVRVSNLDPEVQDMDLVDTFRPKCGAIVHAKIMREKHFHHEKGHSKGWGLVQFEERESVEKALELSEEVGIREKLVKVERSHMSAVGLVPPGMHRVKPKGEGKSSKRNERRREHRQETAHASTLSPAKHKGNTQEQQEEKKSKQPTGSVLAFRPRGVSRGARPKAKLALEKKSNPP